MKFHRIALLGVLLAGLSQGAQPLARADALTLNNGAPATDTNLATPGATAAATTNTPATGTNAAPAVMTLATNSAPAPATEPSVVTTPPELSVAPPKPSAVPATGWAIVGQLLALGGVAGFVAWYCGLTRARHCGHTCAALMCGVVFALIGFWFGGFAVQ